MTTYEAISAKRFAAYSSGARYKIDAKRRSAGTLLAPKTPKNALPKMLLNRTLGTTIASVPKEFFSGHHEKIPNEPTENFSSVISLRYRFVLSRPRPDASAAMRVAQSTRDDSR